MVRIRLNRKDKRIFSQPFLGLEAVEQKDFGLELGYFSGRALIEAIDKRIFRFRLTSKSEWEEKISDAVISKPGADFQVKNEPERLIISTSQLRVIIPEGEFRFEIYDREGKLLSQDFPGAGVRFAPGEFQLHRYISPEEEFYGLGDKYGSLNRRGKVWTFWNRDVGWRRFKKDPRYTSIPFLISLRGGLATGWFFDHPGWLQLELGRRFSSLFSIYGRGEELDFYFLYGPSLKGLIKLYAQLVGTSYLPPLWALGYHQSRYSYFSQMEIEELVEEFEKNDLPLSAIHLDIHYMQDFKVFTVDKNRFPDLKGLSDRLKEKGIYLVAIVDPGLKVDAGYLPYQRTRGKGILSADEKGREYRAKLWPGVSVFPDFFQPEAQEFWADEHKFLFEQGIEGIWNDMNEPSFWKSELRFKDLVIPLRGEENPKMYHRINNKKVAHSYCRNLYGQKQAQATLRAFQKFKPGKRHFILSRSGFAGIQRYAGIWTGDNLSQFGYLASSIAQIVSLGLCGVSFSGADIGGFALNCSPELFARWIELGAFYPFCRNHTAIKTRAQEPYQFGEEVLNIARKYLKLRYRFMPTLYSLFWLAYQTGLPIWRPLFLEFPFDVQAKKIKDQLLTGDSLLLAPVVEQGERKRKVYLPEGRWIDFWQDLSFYGPGWIELKAELSALPMLVREGGILIFQPEPVLKIPWQELIFELYPGDRQGEFVLYEDDGISLDYEKDIYSLRKLVVKKTEKGHQFLISAREGKMELKPRSCLLRFHLKDLPGEIHHNQKKIPAKIIKEKKILEIKTVLDEGENIWEIIY